MHELITNAPPHWPKIRIEGLLPEESPEQVAANRLRFVSTVETTVRGSGVEVLEAGVLRLTREGMVEIHLRMRSAEGDFDVFFYPVADGRAAAHYVALYEMGRKWGRIKPVFYSTDDLLSVYPDEIESVAKKDRLYINASLMPPKGQYAMWWAENMGEMFHYSSTFDLYDRIYRETNGIEAEAFALILLELGMVEDAEEFTSTKLTLSSVEIPLEGPEGVPIIVSFSRERGVRFHFHMDRTSALYRDLFLNLFLMRVKDWKKRGSTIRMMTSDSPSFIWWRELSKRLRAQTGETAISAVGSVKR